MPAKNSHCSYCGAAFVPDQEWPRTCTACGNTSYLNPLPVAVLLMPVDKGFLAIRRKIEPKMGTLNLPGGFINLGETWQQACVRELYEETGIIEQPENVDLLTVKSAPDGTLLVFGRAPHRSADTLPNTTWDNDEVTECIVAPPTATLGFSLHQEVVNEFFSKD